MSSRVQSDNVLYTAYFAGDYRLKLNASTFFSVMQRYDGKTNAAKHHFQRMAND